MKQSSMCIMVKYTILDMLMVRVNYSKKSSIQIILNINILNI